MLIALGSSEGEVRRGMLVVVLARFFSKGDQREGTFGNLKKLCFVFLVELVVFLFLFLNMTIFQS